VNSIAANDRRICALFSFLKSSAAPGSAVNGKAQNSIAVTEKTAPIRRPCNALLI
jgi:hypothetical protein